MEEKAALRRLLTQFLIAATIETLVPVVGFATGVGYILRHWETVSGPGAWALLLGAAGGAIITFHSFGFRAGSLFAEGPATMEAEEKAQAQVDKLPKSDDLGTRRRSIHADLTGYRIKRTTSWITRVHKGSTFNVIGRGAALEFSNWIARTGRTIQAALIVSSVLMDTRLSIAVISKLTVTKPGGPTLGTLIALKKARDVIRGLRIMAVLLFLAAGLKVIDGLPQGGTDLLAALTVMPWAWVAATIWLCAALDLFLLLWKLYRGGYGTNSLEALEVMAFLRRQGTDVPRDPEGGLRHEEKDSKVGEGAPEGSFQPGRA